MGVFKQTQAAREDPKKGGCNPLNPPPPPPTGSTTVVGPSVAEVLCGSFHKRVVVQAVAMLHHSRLAVCRPRQSQKATQGNTKEENQENKRSIACSSSSRKKSGSAIWCAVYGSCILLRITCPHTDSPVEKNRFCNT